ncbi:sensor histidine kinase [Ornithinicoccus halotolerans]|uniref:sensor histidine kinase n=1 Tax=Ornithinicoccus halotolerans TaxID=1748220 RepID=UPI0018860E5D|nr:histidine kinase [Ornithinicoccus halotolerans]
MELTRPRTWDWDAITLWLPVIGVAAVSQTKLGLEEPWTGSDAVLALTSLMQAAPLVARRRYPLVTAALIAVALPVQEVLGGALSFGSFVAVLVATYSVGRHASARAALLGAGLILLGLMLGTRDRFPEDAPELVFPLFYVSAATVIGAVVKRLSEQARQLWELNQALARERDATARLAVAGERMRLSRDLHDSVAHTLTVAVVQAENCELAIDNDPLAAKSAAMAIQEAARRGLSELRSVLRVLRDPEAPIGASGLADLGLLATVVSESGLDVELQFRGDSSTVPADVGHQLFRVAQEALTNVMKHSATKTATVHVAITDTVVELSVTDTGPSLTRGLASGGHGVTVMAERLADLGGEVAAGPYQSGYRVRACVPLTHRVEA